MRTPGNQRIVRWGSNLNLELIGGVTSALTGRRQIGGIIIMKLALNFEFQQAHWNLFRQIIITYFIEGLLISDKIVFSSTNFED